MPRITASTALSRFRVLDFSRVRSGPTCVRVLGDFGADVIRIEPPPGVDPNEAMLGSDRGSGDFQNLNRNKRSITLNLKVPEGVEVFKRLVPHADVVVENWRPDVKRRLGIDYPDLQAINPRIVLASLSGFGQDGPYALRPGFDQIAQGMGGLMSVTGFPGQSPLRVGIAVADLAAGMNAAIGVLVALLEREVSGVGQWVHSSLLHSQIALMDFQAARYLNDGVVPRQEGNDHPTCSPMGMFEAADGALNLGVAGEGIWQRFCQAIAMPHWIADPEYANGELRVRHRARLNREVQAVFATNTVAHWVALLTEAGVPVGPVYTVPEMFADPQVVHQRIAREAHEPDGTVRRVIAQPVGLSRTPAEVVAAAPQLGAHTDEVLQEAGYSTADIARLRSLKAL
jgi:crotonobetainyl-CoA:carnitine CoA-transferase CaiB-like acyl-CoA transferase